jgi:hypothetical protein
VSALRQDIRCPEPCIQVINRRSGVGGHPEVVESAARGYLAHLRGVEAEARPEGRLGLAVKHLIETHEAALSRGHQLDSSDVRFTRSDLSGLDEWQLKAVLDQHGLGLGRDDASIIFMGTEEAYDIEDGGDLALACSLSVLWLCGSRPDVLDAIDPTVLKSAKSPRPRQYHLHPNDYYRVELSRGRGTWECIARVLRPSDPLSLLTPPASASPRPSLGDLCYQIDVSAVPSLRASSGKAPEAIRADFLVHLVAAFTSASALVFHGGPSDETRKLIASSFLKRPVKWTSNSVKREWLAWDASENSRAVLHTYALNGRVRHSYLDLVRAKLLELAPASVPE